MPREIAENSIFWKDTLEHHLLTVEQLDRCLTDIPEEKQTSDKIDNRLARLAIHHGFLTLWQAQRVLTRRTASLFIEKYLLINTLGPGGMGRVFLARDRRLNRLVAIKVLNPDRINHERSLARFEREAQVGGQLQHENLVRIYDVGIYNQSPYLVMEYIEGPTVAELIARHGRLDVAQTARIGRDVALGLQHLAEKKMVHRDVNPRNILIDMEGRAKLTDLGLAIFEEQEAQVTNEGSTVGTFDYISPEQARHSHGVDIRSDLYSLGCSLYHMLSGQVPFPAGSLPEKIYAHQVREPESIRNLVPGLSREMAKIINICLKKKPEERFETAKALAERLGPLVTGEALTGTSELLKSTTIEMPVSSVNDPKEGWNLADKERSWHGENSERNRVVGSSADPDAIQIDLGADSLELPYRLDSKRKTAEKRFKNGRNPLLAIGFSLLIFIVILIGTIWLARTELRTNQGQPDPVTAPEATAKTKLTPAPKTPEPSVIRGITIRYADGQDELMDDLTEAVRRVSGKKAEILVEDRDQPWVWTVTDSSPIAGTRLKISGKGKDLPRVILDLSKSTKGLQVRADSSLDFINLLIESRGQSTGSPLVMSYGELTIEKCRWILRETDAGSRTAFQLSSRRFRIRDTWVHGFTPAIDAQILQDTEIEIHDCLLTEAVDMTASPAKSKAKARQSALISLNLAKLNLNRARIELNHLSLIGDRLIEISGDVTNQKVALEASRCLFKGSDLLTVKSPVIPEELPVRWTGDNNLFDVSESYSKDPSKANPLKTLKEWSQVVSEVDSQERKVRLANPSSQAPSPSDFEPRQKADREFGVR